MIFSLEGENRSLYILPGTLARFRVHDIELSSLTHHQGTVRFAYLNKYLFSR